MHISDFIGQIAPLAPEAAGTTDATWEARVRTHVASYPIRDGAFDTYFSSLLTPFLAGGGSANYPLATLLHFGVHQLSTRTPPENGSPRFVQVGCLDGHEFAAALLRNICTEADLVVERDCGAPIDAALARMPARWRQAPPPRVFRESHRAYLERPAPMVGILGLVGLPGPNEYLAALTAFWPRMHKFGDVIMQGPPPVLHAVLGHIEQKAPSIRGSVLPCRWLSSAGHLEDQWVVVVQREPIDYFGRVRFAADFQQSVWDPRPVSHG